MPRKNKPASKKKPSKGKHVQKQANVSGVPRHRFSVAQQSSSISRTDATKESVTAFLQPFHAYQRRMAPGLPFSGQNMAAYGFWTRNVFTSTDVAFGATATYGSAFFVHPRNKGQIFIATALDLDGKPLGWSSADDVFHASITTNFESVVVGYQGMRVKNLTAVLNQSGESLVGLTPVVDSTGPSYHEIRSCGTVVVKSSADPGVMLEMSYKGAASITPVVAGTVCDYAWFNPSTAIADPASTCMQFRSAQSSAAPQTWEVELVTYYLARPFSASSAFFGPTRHEVNQNQFNRLVDASLSRAPDLSIARNCVKDDGIDATLVADVGMIWSGAKAFGRVASAAWTGLRSFFGLGVEQRRAVLLSLIANDKELKDFIAFAGSKSLDDLAAALQPKPQPFTPAQLRFLEMRDRQGDSKSDDEYEDVTPLRKRR